MAVRPTIAALALLAAAAWGGPAWAQGQAQPPVAKAPGAPAVHPLFEQWCQRCHNINGVNAVCPDLGTIGARRDEAYIRQSILDPNAYIVPGYPRDVMPNFTTLLKPEEVEQLVGWLLTLKGQTLDPNKAGKKVQW